MFGVKICPNFSNYLLNPNKFRFRTVLRVLAMMFLFLQEISKKRATVFDFLKKREFRQEEPNKGECVLSLYTMAHPSNAFNAAKSYFFMKATLEVKQFVIQ